MLVDVRKSQKRERERFSSGKSTFRLSGCFSYEQARGEENNVESESREDGEENRQCGQL